MGKQSITLEDILNEYTSGSAPQKEKTAEPETAKAETKAQAVQEEPVTAEAASSAESETQQYENAFTQSAAERSARKPHYADRRPPMELNRTKVSFIQSSAMEIDPMPMRVNVPSGQKPDETEQKEPPSSTDTPKIRRMSDSTRARELAKRKKKKKKARPEDSETGYTYRQERPEGEYLYTQIHGARKAKNRRKVSAQDADVTAVGTETIHLNARDVVPVAQIPEPEPVEPVEIPPAPRAEKTSINLSAANQETADAASLDVSITCTPEEAEEETRRRQMMSDKMELENVADIRSDIAELRNAISFRILALTMVLLLSGYLAVGSMFSVTWLENLSASMLSTVQTLLGIAAAVVCFPVLKNGFRRLVNFHADTDSLAAVALAGCLGSSILNIFAGGDGMPQLYMPCAILAMLLHSVGKMLIVSREENNLRLATKRFNCYGLTVVEDEKRAETVTRGVLGDFPILATMRHTDSLTDFRKYTYSADLADRFSRYAAPMSFLFSLLASIVLTLLKAESLTYGVTLFSMFAVSCSCAAITFSVSLPMHKATRRMAKNGALMLGYQSVDDFYDVNSLMIDAASMFPDGSVKLSGMKMFTAIKMEETLLAAASLSRHGGSVFSSIFNEVLQGKERKLYPVENFVYEDSMGMCGWIHNQRVLLGNRELMVSHNIEGVPSKSKEAELLGSGKEAVYLSVSGNLSALFLVELTADANVKYWAKQAMRHNLCLILRTVDPMITLHRMAELFDIPQESVKIIPARMQPEYDAETEPVESMSASMACNGSFCGMAQLIIGAKVLRHAAAFGVFIQAVTILLGLGLVLLEVLLHVGLTPGWMLVLQCAATLVTLLAVNIRRIS